MVHNMAAVDYSIVVIVVVTIPFGDRLENHRLDVLTDSKARLESRELINGCYCNNRPMLAQN